MEHKIEIQVACGHCHCKDVCKNGKRPNGIQRWRCNVCQKSFQTTYTYEASKPDVKAKILEQTLNSSGVRDISRNLKVDKNTVIAVLRKKKSPDVNPYLVDKVEAGQLSELEICFYYDTEWDEFWSYVAKKSNQRWTWYAVERKTGLILAFQNGRRTDDSLKKLVQKVAHLPIRICHTDAWAAYEKHLPIACIHRVGKDNTWKIERKNLNFRTHIKRLSRKTICFSKDEEIHDNVIALYISSFYFKHGKYAHARAA